MSGPIFFPTFDGTALRVLLQNQAGALDAVGYNLLDYGSPYLPANSLSNGMLLVSATGNIGSPVPGESIGIYLKLFNPGAEPTDPADCVAVGNFVVPVGEDTTMSVTIGVFLSGGTLRCAMTLVGLGSLTSNLINFTLGEIDYPATVDLSLPIAVKLSLNSITNPLAPPTQPNTWDLSGAGVSYLTLSA